jgi:hypothetical protein
LPALAVGVRCARQAFPRLNRWLAMAEVVQDAQQEFWRYPAVLPPAESVLPAAQAMAEACAACGTEFLTGAKFCHSCGLRRPVLAHADALNAVATGPWARSLARIKTWPAAATSFWQRIPFPSWLRYLHFHEIQRGVGLPTAALVAFMIGLGCVAGAIGVSLFYKASNLAEFQAIQMWRIEWLLAATAAFVAGILLKKPSDPR